MNQTACIECGEAISFEPIAFHGLSVGTPRYCDRCVDLAVASEENDAAEERLRRRVEKSGLPKRLQDLPLSSTPLGALAEDWANGSLSGLCLTGPVGVGKTYAAAAACWAKINTGRSCRWVSVARLMTQLRAGFGDDARAAAIAAVAGEGAIVLDDLDKVSPTDYGREVIFAAVDGRVEAGAPLLVTTNLEPDQIGDKLGDAVMSRLVGYCTTVRMQGDDRRLA